MTSLLTYHLVRYRPVYAYCAASQPKASPLAHIPPHTEDISYVEQRTGDVLLLRLRAPPRAFYRPDHVSRLLSGLPAGTSLSLECGLQPEDARDLLQRLGQVGTSLTPLVLRGAVHVLHPGD